MHTLRASLPRSSFHGGSPGSRLVVVGVKGREAQERARLPRGRSSGRQLSPWPRVRPRRSHTLNSGSRQRNKAIVATTATMPLSRRPRAGVLPALAEYVKVNTFQVALFHVHLEGSLRSTLQRRRASLNGRSCANAPSLDVRGYHETALTTGLAPFSAAQRLFGHGPQVEYATTAGCQLRAREATAGPQQRRRGLGALGIGLKALSDTVHDKKVFHDQSEEHNLAPRFDTGTNETSMTLFRGVQGRAVPRWLDVPIHYGLAASLSNGTTTESGSFSCSWGGLGTRQSPKLYRTARHERGPAVGHLAVHTVLHDACLL